MFHHAHPLREQTILAAHPPRFAFLIEAGPPAAQTQN
jgi:hypothetical protein